MIYLGLFLISIILTYGIQVSGFWEEISTIISGWLTEGKVRKPFELKPFSCPKCATFWTGLIYIIIMNKFTLPVLAFLCLMSFLTNVWVSAFYLIENLMMKLIQIINKKLEL